MTQEKVEEFDEFDGKIPVMDKRRFNADGSRTAEGEAAAAKPAEAVKSAAETALELQLKAEIERREAAEAKLIGVQAKFDEAKAAIEKETQEMRDRMKRSLEDRATQAQFNFLTTLLPVLDTLNLAVTAGETDPSVEHLRDGVVGTARLFEQALGSVGVEPIPAVGEVFDPELHEAVDMIPVGPEDVGKVIQEYGRGYKLNGKLLRPARVQVGKGE
ncbi:MAG: nucleotide exchange factor GrpE [Acidobacteria bacterium]|nr:nucleotide exchange factor GrpE [Acidobacteriota bacterium]HMU34814.1 nucleotide exchange factor GrpE [Pyrinomonadaceae bacterium]